MMEATNGLIRRQVLEDMRQFRAAHAYAATATGASTALQPTLAAWAKVR